jgi:hypothetical protein
MPRTLNNRAQKDKKRRAKLRARLRAEGMSEDMIEVVIARRRHADLVARVGEEEARRVRRAYAPKDPDDTGYKPSLGDPLLRGAARAGGMTAKVVKRRNTITRHQHERETRRSG